MQSSAAKAFTAALLIATHKHKCFPGCSIQPGNPILIPKVWKSKDEVLQKGSDVAHYRCVKQLGK